MTLEKVLIEFQSLDQTLSSTYNPKADQRCDTPFWGTQKSNPQLS